jgi:hypothetical protein
MMKDTLEKIFEKMQRPSVKEALAAISRFLDQVGLSSTVRALASEVEKKGGKKETIYQGMTRSGHSDLEIAIEKCLLAALNMQGKDETTQYDATRYSKTQGAVFEEIRNSCLSTLPITSERSEAEVWKDLNSRARTLTARLRSAEESGVRDRDIKSLKVSTDKIRLSKSAPVALLRGHREPLVNLEILAGICLLILL